MCWQSFYSLWLLCYCKLVLVYNNKVGKKKKCVCVCVCVCMCVCVCKCVCVCVCCVHITIVTRILIHPCPPHRHPQSHSTLAVLPLLPTNIPSLKGPGPSEIEEEGHVSATNKMINTNIQSYIHVNVEPGNQTFIHTYKQLLHNKQLGNSIQRNLLNCIKVSL